MKRPARGRSPNRDQGCHGRARCGREFGHDHYQAVHGSVTSDTATSYLPTTRKVKAGPGSTTDKLNRRAWWAARRYLPPAPLAALGWRGSRRSGTVLTVLSGDPDGDIRDYPYNHPLAAPSGMLRLFPPGGIWGLPGLPGARLVVREPSPQLGHAVGRNKCTAGGEKRRSGSSRNSGDSTAP